MKLVVIESPFAGDVAANVEYAKRCVRDCLARGESPYASHLFFTQRGILDDDDPTERKLGIDAGLAWARAADAVVVYIDRGISDGMRYGMTAHLKSGKALFIRSLERDVSVQEIGNILEGLRASGDSGVQTFGALADSTGEVTSDDSRAQRDALPDDPEASMGGGGVTLHGHALPTGVQDGLVVERLDRRPPCLECKGVGHLDDPRHDGGQRCCPSCGGQGFQD